MTTFQNVNALSVICLYICFKWITEYIKYRMLSKKMGPGEKTMKEVVGKSRFIILDWFICPLSSLVYIMFKCPVEFSLPYALGIFFLFPIENKYLIALTLNHAVFDEKQWHFFPLKFILNYFQFTSK